MQANRLKLFHSVGIFCLGKHEMKLSNLAETSPQGEVSQSK